MEIALQKFGNKQSFSGKKVSALGVYWVCFGSSGYIEEPSGLIIENYRYRAKDGYHNNRHIKSFLRGQQAATSLDAHSFKTQFGTYDENLRPITYGLTDYQPTYAKFRINHYVTQSRWFFLNFKSKFITPDGGGTPDESFWAEHDRNEVFDHSMDKFITSPKK